MGQGNIKKLLFGGTFLCQNPQATHIILFQQLLHEEKCDPHCEVFNQVTMRAAI